MIRTARGQALVFFAIAVPAALLPVAGLAVDASVLAARQAALAGAVETTALDLAAQVDASALRAGTGWNADSAVAATAAAAYLAAVDPNAVLDAVTVSGGTVTVAAHDSVPATALLLVPVPPGVLHASASARLRHGLASPD